MISFFLNAFTVFLLCCSSLLSAEKSPAYLSNFWSGEKEHYRMSVRHIESGGIGYDNGYTSLEAFIAPVPNPVTLMPFLDIRGHGFDNGDVAANIGVGLRKISKCRVFGFHAYYDYRNTENKNYSQMAFGVESLGKRWDFRVNAYLPTEREISPVGEFQLSGFSGNNMMLSQSYQFAMKGANANFGLHFGRNKVCDFYACAGTYFYAGKIGPHIWGGKASLMVRFNKYVTLEISNSYDKMFLNRFQVGIGFAIPFGTCSDESLVDDYRSCDSDDLLLSRMTQPIQRQEIIVIGQTPVDTVAINPATGIPFTFIFVDNMSNSLGTYESPYHSLRQAQNNSQPGDIIYVYPGDGTTKGMDAGITLQENQNFWGSGINHTLQTTQGAFTIPAQSTTAPTITNIDIDTLGDAITVSSVNNVSGFTIINAYNNAILGSNVENLTVDHCTFQGTGLYCINSTSPGQAHISVTNNTMTDNTNGSIFDFSGPSNLVISDNTISLTTSISSFPIAIAADTSSLNATITNNNISNNEIGAVQLVLNDTSLATLTIRGNTITNNNAGSAAQLGSAIVINPLSSTTGNCHISLTDNILSDNQESALYCHTSGGFNDFQATITNNTCTNNGHGLSFANNCTTLMLTATDNIISNNSDNGIAVTGATVTTANITISDNQITENTGSGCGITFAHSGTELNAIITGNNISDNTGSGILLFSSTGIENVNLNIENNMVNNNQNIGSNATGGIDIEQYTNLSMFLTNNNLSSNNTSGLYVGSTLSTPFVDLQMKGNSSDNGYTLSNPGDGEFNLAPCNVEIVNSGIITTSGTITPVQSCPDDQPCT